MYENGLQGILIFLLVALVIMLIIREVWCWYWKINIAVGKLEDMDKKLGSLDKTLKSVDKNIAHMASYYESSVDEAPVDELQEIEQVEPEAEGKESLAYKAGQAIASKTSFGGSA